MGEQQPAMWDKPGPGQPGLPDLLLKDGRDGPETEHPADPAALTGRTIRLALLLITAAGLLVRALHFSAIAGTAFPKIPQVFTDSDMHAIWQWAQTILAGDLLGRDTSHPNFQWMQAMAPMETWYRWWGGKEIFQQAPLYAYWVAGLLAVSGRALPAVLFAQLLVGALQPLVMFAVARRLFDARAGLVAALLTALYGPLIFYQGVLLRDWLPPILEGVALLLLLRARASERRRDWALAGAVLGIALLAKETVLLFLPLVVVWLVWEHRGPSWKAAVATGCLAAGLLATASPLVIRNALVGAPFLALSNRAAEGFILGNAADGFPIGMELPSSMKGILARTDGRLLPVMRETLKTYDGDWGRLFRHQLLKLRGLADPLEVPDNLAFSYGLEISPVLRFMLGYGLLFPLGLAGFVVTLSRWRGHLLLLLHALPIVGGILLSIVHARYRLALVPTLIFFGAAGVASCLDQIRARRWARAIAYVGLVSGFLAFQHLLVPLEALRQTETVVIHTPSYYFSGQIYAAANQFDRAAEEFERLGRRARQHPGFPGVAAAASLLEGDNRAKWAQQLLAQERPDEARRQMALAENSYRDHGNLAYTQYNLGLLYLKLGEPAKARAFLTRFLEVAPADPRGDQVRRLLSRLAGTP